MKFIYKLFIVLTIIIILILMFPIKANTNEITLPEAETVVEPMYYQPAELIDEYLCMDGSYYITFIFAETENDGNIFIWESEGSLPDDIPYLLCMDSKGTKEITDDEIIVVWGCMN